MGERCDECQKSENLQDAQLGLGIRPIEPRVAGLVDHENSGPCEASHDDEGRENPAHEWPWARLQNKDQSGAGGQGRPRNPNGQGGQLLGGFAGVGLQIAHSGHRIKGVVQCDPPLRGDADVNACGFACLNAVRDASSGPRHSAPERGLSEIKQKTTVLGCF